MKTLKLIFSLKKVSLNNYIFSWKEEKEHTIYFIHPEKSLFNQQKLDMT